MASASLFTRAELRLGARTRTASRPANSRRTATESSCPHRRTPDVAGHARGGQAVRKLQTIGRTERGRAMANATMEVEELSGGVTKVRLKGRLDIAGAAEIDLRFNALAGAQRAVIVDLSMVDFLASMGLRTLI